MEKAATSQYNQNAAHPTAKTSSTPRIVSQPATCVDDTGRTQNRSDPERTRIGRQDQNGPARNRDRPRGDGRPSPSIWTVRETDGSEQARTDGTIWRRLQRAFFGHPVQVRGSVSQVKPVESELMEFLVQFEVDIPDSVAKSEVEDGERAEAAAAGMLADQGHLVRLWQVSVGTGQTTVLGLNRAGSQAELDGLLGALPLYKWMRTSITPLVQHPNDPGIRAII
jgi:muconolactone D-isomerase